MNATAKTLMCRVLAASGLLAMLERFSASGQNVVLTLHRVLPQAELADCYNPHLALSAEAFEALLQFLVQRFSVISLSELLDGIQKSGNGARSCALTFDDGWEDNYRIAFPILEKYRLPASIFLATGYVGSKMIMPEERLFRLWKRAEDQDRTAQLQKDLDELLPSSGPANQKQLQDYHRRSKFVSYCPKTALLDRLEQKYGTNGQVKPQFLNWEQIDAMARAWVTFESHTVHHKLLAQETDDEIRDELMASKRAIAERIGYHTRVLAYPSGSFDQRVVRIAAEAGYRAALTTIPGGLRPLSDMYRLPRIAIANDALCDAHAHFSPARTRFHILRSVFATPS